MKNEIQQLQSESNLTTEDKENDSYEVEKILSHSVIKRGNKKELHFFVRWKDYDSSDDSWVRENNLDCDSILKQYKKKNNLR